MGTRWGVNRKVAQIHALLLLVVFFTDAKPGIHAYPAEAIKDTLFQSLFGIFISITMSGRVIWKAIAADTGLTTLMRRTNSNQTLFLLNPLSGTGSAGN